MEGLVGVLIYHVEMCKARLQVRYLPNTYSPPENTIWSTLKIELLKLKHEIE